MTPRFTHRTVARHLAALTAIALLPGCVVQAPALPALPASPAAPAAAAEAAAKSGATAEVRQPAGAAILKPGATAEAWQPADAAVDKPGLTAEAPQAGLGIEAGPKDPAVVAASEAAFGPDLALIRPEALAVQTLDAQAVLAAGERLEPGTFDPRIVFSGDKMPMKLRATVVSALRRPGVMEWAACGVLGITDRAGHRYYASFGEKRVGAGEGPDEDTLFQIASVSKPLVAVAFTRLAAERGIGLDEKAEAYTGFALPTGPNGEAITLRHLLTHRSGLPMQPVGGYRLSTAQLEAYFAGNPRLMFAPGTRSSYSNFGFAVLAHIYARLSGADYDRAVEAQFFRPLGMTRTSHNGAPDANRTYRYVREVRDMTQVPDGTVTVAPANLSPLVERDFEDFTGLYAGGGVRTTARDMLTFLGAHLDATASDAWAAADRARSENLGWGGVPGWSMHGGAILAVRANAVIESRRPAGTVAVTFLVNTSLNKQPDDGRDADNVRMSQLSAQAVNDASLAITHAAYTDPTILE